jgi:DNA-binding transcriptional MerR regulator
VQGNHIFSISGFARLSRVTRGTLIFYDKAGLLPPVLRGNNGYRYYSASQLAVVNLIRTCQELGMSLDEIKGLMEQRTPVLVDEFLTNHIKRVDEKINEWIRARKLLTVLQGTIHSAADIDASKIFVEFIPAAAIVLGDLNDYSKGRNDYDALLDFLFSCNKKYPDMDLNYPVWGVFSEQRIRHRDWVWPDRFYFNNPSGYDQRPAALYAVGYGTGGYGQCGDLYERMMAFISANGYEVCGPAYEEYPLNEICVADSNSYLIRVMITVRKKGGRKPLRNPAG